MRTRQGGRKRKQGKGEGRESKARGEEEKAERKSLPESARDVPLTTNKTKQNNRGKHGIRVFHIQYSLMVARLCTGCVQ